MTIRIKIRSHYPVQMLLLAGCILLSVVFARSQSSTAQSDYESAPVENPGFEEKDWKKATAGLDFNEKIKPARNRRTFNTGLGGINPAVAKVMIILVGALALAFILYQFFGKNHIPANKRIDKIRGLVLDADKLEEEVLEAPFEAYIQEALQQRQYALAIRLHYLWALQTLAHRQLIHWKKDKTNREFLAELRPTALGGPFSQATAVYEWVWYGDQTITKQHYQQYAGLFAPLTTQLAASPEKSAGR
ncbi:MAG: DUF4129 domain-containing protein [Saprospiraceae bacterium]|nr:DUF4129 domain-containing protein [Saprospiraceae bacterium]